ncbi:MAG: hypothetical protein AMXMBFR53_42000 [Gemmatimonadota bacterium]
MPPKRKRKPKRGTFAERLNLAWSWSGLPVLGVAERLATLNRHGSMRGVSHVQVGRYLDAEVEPSLDVAHALATVLEVSPCWLLSGEGLPDPLGITDRVRPLWRIDGPMGAEEAPTTMERRREARASFEEGFKPWQEEWEQLAPTVKLLFGNLLARRMLAARHEGAPWREPFWRGQEAARMGAALVEAARKHRGPERVPDGEPLGSPAFCDLLIQFIAKQLGQWRDRANPTTKGGRSHA